MAFLDNQRGWLSDGERVFRTQNGGQTWEELAISRQILGLVRFSSATTGLAVGWSTTYPFFAVLLRTTDGGSNWSDVSALPTGADSVWSNADGTRLWTVGQGGQISRSTDGGASWTPVSSPTTANLHHVQFADSSRGWAAGENGVVLRTDNGGATWSLTSTGSDAAVTSLAVAPSGTAWIYGDGLRRSYDSGATWQVLPYVAGDATSLAMGSATTGWASRGSQLLKTEDAGGVWFGQPGTSGASIVDAVDAQHAWALSAAALQRTTDPQPDANPHADQNTHTHGDVHRRAAEPASLSACDSQIAGGQTRKHNEHDRAVDRRRRSLRRNPGISGDTVATKRWLVRTTG